ncbi:RNA recognition motif domain-containing protein [Ditylenchus destructor]|uniref:RNA recognition motif domain-containing protein n=1 Tax=Ditylenchus destructor TaxID=166010 RepID=A0AAD4R3V2_9BILA|nr:RNA recognition motif domain-containing protein [Ditylenchus destructor]
MSALQKVLQRCFKTAAVPGVSSLFRLQLCSSFNVICTSRQAHITSKFQAFKIKRDPGDELLAHLRIGRLKAPAKSEQFKRDKKKVFQDHRILVYGLTKRTKEKSVLKHFGRFGKVLDCHVKKQTASVEFQTQTQAAAAVGTLEHHIDGQEVSVMAYSATDLRKRQIIVRGLSEETSPSTLRKFYSQFGEIALCRIAREEQNVSLGYAHVIFDSEEAVELALNSLPHRIGDMEITEVERTPMPPDMERTIEVRDLSLETTNESLEKFYSQFGEVTRCEVKGTKTIRHGTVEFVTKKAMMRAMSKLPHFVDGKEIIDVKRYKSKRKKSKEKKKLAAAAAAKEAEETDD